jgi:hypothetical protein
MARVITPQITRLIAPFSPVAQAAITAARSQSVYIYQMLVGLLTKAAAS